MTVLAESVIVLAGGRTLLVVVTTSYTVEVVTTTLVENFVADLVTVTTEKHMTLLSMAEA
jgi:hypothetical protein